MTFQPLISTGMVVLFALVGVALIVVPMWKGRGGGAWATLRRLAMVAVMTFALAGPAIAVEEEDVVSNVEIILAVDRTGSMAAEDGPDGSARLEAVRRDIRTLVESAASARFAVVTWDSSARLELPVTTDASAVVNFSDNLHQEVSEFSTGSSLGRPAQTVMELLESSADERPENLRYLVLFSDGESTSEASDLDSWTGVIDLIDGGAVLGYGTEEGGPMRVYGVGGQGVTDEYMTDDSGEVAVSRLDEQSLQTVASELGVPLLLNPTSAQIEALGADFTAHAGTVVEGRKHSYTYSYLTWIPALALAGLVAWEAFGFVRRAAALRRTRAL